MLRRTVGKTCDPPFLEHIVDEVLCRCCDADESRPH